MLLIVRFILLVSHHSHSCVHKLCVMFGKVSILRRGSSYLSSSSLIRKCSNHGNEGSTVSPCALRSCHNIDAESVGEGQQVSCQGVLLHGSKVGKKKYPIRFRGQGCQIDIRCLYFQDFIIKNNSARE